MIDLNKTAEDNFSFLLEKFKGDLEYLKKRFQTKN